MKSPWLTSVAAVLMTVVQVQSSDWWLAFENKTLHDAVTAGLAAHPDLSSALAAVLASKASADLARAQREPSAAVSLGARLGRERTVYSDRRPGDSAPFMGEAEFAWELDVTGRLKANNQSATANTRATQAEVDAVRLMLATEIVRAIIDLAALEASLGIARTISTHEGRLLDRTQRRHEAGLLAGPEVEEAKANLNSANHESMLTLIGIEKERDRLTALLGGTPWTNTVDGLDTFSVPAMPDAGSMTNAVTRPDVQRAWWALQSAEAAASARRLDRLPTLALMASAAGEMSEDGETEPWQAWIGPVLKLPAWSPSSKAERAKSDAEAQAAAAHFQSVSLTALREIGNAITDRSYADTMMDHTRNRHQEVAKVAASSQRRRDAGLIGDDDWLRSEIEALNAEREALEWRRQALLSHVNMVYALGD